MSNSNIPSQVATLLHGQPTPGSWEQAFPFVTVDENGHPHVALLTRSEMDVAPDDSKVLAVIASTRTRANLARDGKATLIAVGGTSAYYVKMQLVRTVEAEGALACAFRVVEFKEDSLGIPLVAMGFEATPEIARMERWERSARLMQRVHVERAHT